MKKIILAVASLLALGMLVSCKQEISGNLTVTDLQYDAFKATTETYYYKVTGTVKYVSVITQTTRTDANASEVTANTYTNTFDYNVNSKNPVVTVTVSKDPTTNVTTYTINVPALEGKYTSVNKVGTADPTTSYNPATRVASDADPNDVVKPVTITKIGSTFYYENTNGEQIVIEGFDPTAATLDLSKLPKNEKTTTTSGTPSYTTSGEAWYPTKTVKTTTETYSLTYTKL